jgi:hypothetical protein
MVHIQKGKMVVVALLVVEDSEMGPMEKKPMAAEIVEHNPPCSSDDCPY